MSTQLQNLEPKALFRHFEALAAIPRASGKEAAARAYVLAQAARLGLEAVQDGVGNVVVRKPARPGREQAPTVALQGHLDMVCEKNEETVHDFDIDPIRLVIDGEWLKADGTTLGADNGIGVAAALSVMESEEIAHGPLEFVFTIDEETGLTGAVEFPEGLLRSKYFLNLDGEEMGTLCIGCAGGLNTVARRKVAWEPAGAGAGLRVKVSGLQGGHSGIDIHKGRGNAVRILGCLLQLLLERMPVAIGSLQGGSKRNAIPREASATLLIDPTCEKDIRALLASLEKDIADELGSFDAGLRLTADAADCPATVMAAADAVMVAGLLSSQHHGVLAMSPDVPGLVLTSTNLATVSIAAGEVVVETSQRSAIESAKRNAARMVSTLFAQAGFTSEHSGGYPGWKPEPGSDIVRQSQQVHEELFGAKAELIAMHAGLECGVIGEKHPGMEMISFGPLMIDVHSPSERLKIPTVAPFWSFLTRLLERL